ncbi:MAG: hypothetical protein OXS29_20000 [bacterium]|nr:hypothetical protein [bacterium]MDE0289521.1 hypothetical protein [bacterium]MDE0439554.1 hypothetical protein [bacterium]
MPLVQSPPKVASFAPNPSSAASEDPSLGWARGRSRLRCNTVAGGREDRSGARTGTAVSIKGAETLLEAVVESVSGAAVALPFDRGWDWRPFAVSGSSAVGSRSVTVVENSRTIGRGSVTAGTAMVGVSSGPERVSVGDSGEGCG